MNTATQQKVLQWIQATTDKIQDFAVTEIPPFIHEYLNWKFWEAGIEIILYTLIMVILWSLFLTYGIKGWKKCLDLFKDRSYHNCNEFFILIPIAYSAVLFFITLIPFPYEQIKDCIQIKIAPKIFLVEKAVELIKK